MAHEKLNSERVNYLVWRYLQESGFGQSAARLQRDWGITDPERLAFAPHIGPHSLVRLLQNGLYHLGVRASLSTNGRESMPFFGPGVAVTASAEEFDQIQRSPALLQRPNENLTNGASADGALQATPKRSRRSNGATNGRTKSGEGMDVGDGSTSKLDNEMVFDRHENGGDATTLDSSRIAGAEAEFRDTNGEGSGASQIAGAPVQEQLMPTLTNGLSKGVQSDDLKVTDLGPETAVLHLQGTVFTQAAWHPKHPTLMAAGGKALCQIWSLDLAHSRSGMNGTATPATDSNSHTNSISPSDTIRLGIDGTASVTALAWNPQGEDIAYSTFPDESSVLQRSVTGIWSRDGALVDQLPAGTEPVVSLAWSESGRYLAAVTGRSIFVYDKKLLSVISQQETSNALLEVVWIDEGQFAVCGESIIAITAVTNDGVAEPFVISQPEISHDWSQMRYDNHTSTIAVISEDSGYLALVQADGSFRATKAHEDTLTGLAYRPVVNSDALSSASKRLLATSSVDGSVKLWNTRACLEHVYTFDLGAAALALCFTPDGHHVAAASWDKILFWSAQGGRPKAMWDSTRSGRQHENGESNHVNGTNGISNGDVDMTEDSEHVPILAWNLDGNKLALACKDKVTIINYHQ